MDQGHRHVVPGFSLQRFLNEPNGSFLGIRLVHEERIDFVQRHNTVETITA